MLRITGAIVDIVSEEAQAREISQAYFLELKGRIGKLAFALGVVEKDKYRSPLNNLPGHDLRLEAEIMTSGNHGKLLFNGISKHKPFKESRMHLEFNILTDSGIKLWASWTMIRAKT